MHITPERGKIMLTDDGIYVRRNHSGGIELAKIVGNTRVHKVFMFFSLEEALEAFRAKIKSRGY